MTSEKYKRHQKEDVSIHKWNADGNIAIG